MNGQWPLSLCVIRPPWRSYTRHLHCCAGSFTRFPTSSTRQHFHPYPVETSSPPYSVTLTLPPPTRSAHCLFSVPAGLQQRSGDRSKILPCNQTPISVRHDRPTIYNLASFSTNESNGYLFRDKSSRLSAELTMAMAVWPRATNVSRSPVTPNTQLSA